MKTITKYCTLLTIICCMICIASCTGVGEYQKSIYDDKLKILADGDSFTYRSKVGAVESNAISLDVKGFYGKETVWKIEAKNDSLLYLNIASDITKGKFKMCYINSNSEVVVIFEGSQDDIIPITVLAGSSRIVLVGNNANGNISVSLAEVPENTMEIIPITFN